MVLTCTVSNTQKKLLESGTKVSLSNVMSLKPFFITYPTEKKNFICACVNFV